MSEPQNSPQSSDVKAQSSPVEASSTRSRLQARAELSRIRHDLRISIGHAIGYCEMLLEDESVPKDFLDDLHKIHGGGRKCLALINQCFHEDSISGDRDLHQLCHELCTPVNHIVGYSEMLQERLMSGPDLIRICRRSTGQLSTG
jgi:signal transduction histidine kinase